jgi:hypothetical protein
MDFKININFRDTIKAVQQVKAKDIPFLTSLALNKTAFDALKHTQGKMKEIFDRPTNWVLKSMYVNKSDKKDNPISAEVGFKTWANKGRAGSKIIYPEVMGGQRLPKPAEARLRRHGIIRSNQFIVQAPGRHVDQYGNIPHQQWNRMLSSLEAASGPGYDANTKATSKRSKVRRKYILSKSGKSILIKVDSVQKRGGIYVPLFYVVDPFTYKRTFPVDKIVRNRAQMMAPIFFAEAAKRIIENKWEKQQGIVREKWIKKPNVNSEFDAFVISSMGWTDAR